ncbi:MAG: hypothetical protein PGN34_13015 [Methylobacterium frigidaeris]
MIQIETQPPHNEIIEVRPVPIADRVRNAALIATLVIGVPLTLAWFVFVGWLVIWMLRAILGLL